jgi:hypothetical protein
LRYNNAVTDIPLDHPRLQDGWWALEQDGCQHARWTNGHATLPLALEGPAMLEIEFGTLPAYALDEDGRMPMNPTYNCHCERSEATPRKVRNTKGIAASLRSSQ